MKAGETVVVLDPNPHAGQTATIVGETSPGSYVVLYDRLTEPCKHCGQGAVPVTDCLNGVVLAAAQDRLELGEAS